MRWKPGKEEERQHRIGNHFILEDGRSAAFARRTRLNVDHNKVFSSYFGRICRRTFEDNLLTERAGTHSDS